MGNEEKPETNFVDFVRGVKHPKLSYIMTRLDRLGIKYQLGTCWTGPRLRVKEGDIEAAHGVLLAAVGLLEDTRFDDPYIRVMELPSDHPYFEHTQNVVAEVIAVEEIDASTLPSLDEVAVELSVADSLEEGPENVAEEFEAIMEQAEEPDPFEIEEETMAPVENDDPFADDTPIEDEGDLWDTEEETEVVEDPELDYLRADKALGNGERTFNGVNGPVLMYETNSANVSSIGAKINQNDQTKCTMYAVFKGGTNPYRYGPVPTRSFYDLLGEAVRKSEGRQEASVGSMFHYTIKVPSDEGHIQCQRLTENGWVPVLPKKERTKELKRKVQENG